MNSDKLVAVDLFAGAGGLSTGLVKAIIDTHAETIAAETGLSPDDLSSSDTRVHWWLAENVELHAVNHWEPAIATHEQNHPWAEHYHAKIEELHPPDVVEPGEVDLLVGGPSCTHHSRARGGKPVKEQKRASGWHVLHWIEHLRPENILLENVPEFRDWAPIVDGTSTRDGSIFQRWIGMLEALGYSVLYDDEAEDYGAVLNAADYGEAQSRTRLFIMASQDTRPTAPEPTHVDADPAKPDRRTAADIIDWSDLGSSLWTRDLENPRVQPLAQSTMARIAEGIRRHCDDRLAPLADALEAIGKEELRALRETVVPAEHAATVAAAVDRPFLVRVPNGQTALTTPQVLGQHSNSIARDVSERPIPTVATGGKIHLTNPETFCLRQQSGGVPADVDVPLPTVATKGAIGMASAEATPLIKPRNGSRGDLHSNALYEADSRPLHTVTASNHDGHLVTPTLIHYSHGGALRDPTSDVLPTVATEKGGAFALSSPVVQPFIDEYYGNGQSNDVADPLPTVTKKDRFALCVPEVFPFGLDVRYRMLEPDELKQAQGFPADYELAGGTKKTVTEQIGNAVPVNLARALCRHLLVDETPSLATFGGGVTADPDAEVPAYSEVIESDD
ncbi:C-5 cytosine-specific DNA methylase (plasmid) [Haloterrigena turkmenica DSM 5511]|uniref:DNA (cytosine-5-)-methyltransferase n=1 Tax=Haloterrigena turkmenica (strain ATCC 51198 / DSM 5511 / JCM 9101 / NCIMB 13204 / VKM B-1734 / 4k) TaxID=543526 RepID=D2S3N0_HALTV|nr:DNA cytosine methyltransferase [Haloterrigena turkmenica]ADB63977.1 C-5 cytosine-specific DNA methylase [Haloterrigena turkmenica DSM 5511]